MSVAPPRDPDPGPRSAASLAAGPPDPGDEPIDADRFDSAARELEEVFDLEAVEPVSERIEVPDHGDGSRARLHRRPPSPIRELVARRRLPTGAAPRAAATVVGLVAALALVLALVSVLIGDGENPLVGPTATEAAAPATEESASPALVVNTTGEGEVSAIAVVGEDDTGAGHVLLLPLGAMAEVPSFGLEEIARAHQLGGPPLLRSSVEALLGIQVGAVWTLDPESLSAALEPVADRFDTERPGLVMTQPTDDGGLAALARHETFWRGWVSALGGEVPVTGGGADESALVTRLGSFDPERLSIHTLPVESVGGAVGDEDLYRVDRAALSALTARAFPAAAPLADAERTRVQILNGTGEPGLAQQVTVRVVPAGARVVVIDNADGLDHDSTEILYYDPEHEEEAERLREALGVGEVVLSDERLDVVDVTIVVGRDFEPTGGGS